MKEKLLTVDDGKILVCPSKILFAAHEEEEVFFYRFEFGRNSLLLEVEQKNAFSCQKFVMAHLKIGQRLLEDILQTRIMESKNDREPGNTPRGVLVKGKKYNFVIGQKDPICCGLKVVEADDSTVSIPYYQGEELVQRAIFKPTHGIDQFDGLIYLFVGWSTKGELNNFKVQT